MDVVYYVHMLMAFIGGWLKTDLQNKLGNNVAKTKQLSCSLGSYSHTENRVGPTNGNKQVYRRQSLFWYGKFLYMRLLCKQVCLKSGPSVARGTHTTKWRAGNHTHTNEDRVSLLHIQQDESHKHTLLLNDKPELSLSAVVVQEAPPPGWPFTTDSWRR